MQFAFYFVDWDFGGRKQSVQLIDRNSFADISGVQMMHSFEGGVWMVWQYRYNISIVDIDAGDRDDHHHVFCLLA